jgi:hypothetical protein
MPHQPGTSDCAGAEWPRDDNRLEEVERAAAQTVPARLAVQVELHILRNFAAHPPLGTPLIQVIHGSPGTGKSWAIHTVLAERGIQAVTLSAADLESEMAGTPAKTLHAAYRHAGTLSQHDRLAALVLDDLDAGLGDWGPLVSSTTNRQQLLQAFMNPCDRPEQAGVHTTLRVPILCTANDVTRLYAPLTRPGRSQLVFWEPNLTEQAAMILRLFPALRAASALWLAQSFPGSTAGFWAQVYATRADDGLAQRIAQHGFQTVLDAVLDGRTPMAEPTPEQLWRAGQRLCAQQQDLADRTTVPDVVDLTASS